MWITTTSPWNYTPGRIDISPYAHAERLSSRRRNWTFRTVKLWKSGVCLLPILLLLQEDSSTDKLGEIALTSIKDKACIKILRDEDVSKSRLSLMGLPHKPTPVSKNVTIIRVIQLTPIDRINSGYPVLPCTKETIFRVLNLPLLWGDHSSQSDLIFSPHHQPWTPLRKIVLQLDFSDGKQLDMSGDMNAAEDRVRVCWVGWG